MNARSRPPVGERPKTPEIGAQIWSPIQLYEFGSYGDAKKSRTFAQNWYTVRLAVMCDERRELWLLLSPEGDFGRPIGRWESLFNNDKVRFFTNGLEIKDVQELANLSA